VTDLPWFEPGQELRYRETGSTWTIVSDWRHHPDVAQTADVTDDRFYVVAVHGHRDVVHHDIIELACDPVKRPTGGQP
jgi:hypothetical protein